MNESTLKILTEPALNLALDILSKDCFVELNAYSKVKSIIPQSALSDKAIQDAIKLDIDKTAEDIIKKLNVIIATHGLERLMSITIPVILQAAISPECLPYVAQHLKSKKCVCSNRILLNFELKQPSIQLENIQTDNSLRSDNSIPPIDELAVVKENFNQAKEDLGIKDETIGVNCYGSVFFQNPYPKNNCTDSEAIYTCNGKSKGLRSLIPTRFLNKVITEMVKPFELADKTYSKVR